MVATYHSKLKGPRPRKQPKHGVDRISELPDEVLCHILSFLPSKETCATTVLSTRWRSLWTMVPVLDFVANSVTPLKEFSTIVNEFLTLRTTQRITRLRLKCTKELCHQDDVDKWVSSATEGKVEQLELSLHHISGYMCSTTNLFTCGTIVTLKLRGCFYLSVPSSSSIHLPFLKTLHLNVGGNSEDVSKLLSGCPALEVFRVKLICFEGSFKICVPSLKQLRVVARCCQVKQLEMNTPCLECLDLCHCVYIHDYVFGNLQNVVRAKINIDIRVDGDEYEDCLHGVFKLLKLLPNVRFFSFYDFTMKKMENLFIVLDRPAHFRNLVHLQLSLRMGYGLFFLEKLLRKCRKLQVQPFTRTGPNNCSYFSEECKGLDDLKFRLTTRCSGLKQKYGFRKNHRRYQGDLMHVLFS